MQYFDYSLAAKKTMAPPQFVGELQAILFRSMPSLGHAYTIDFAFFVRDCAHLVTKHASLLPCVPPAMHDNPVVLALLQRIYEYMQLIQVGCHLFVVSYTSLHSRMSMLCAMTSTSAP